MKLQLNRTIQNMQTCLGKVPVLKKNIYKQIINNTESAFQAHFIFSHKVLCVYYTTSNNNLLYDVKTSSSSRQEGKGKIFAIISHQAPIYLSDLSSSPLHSFPAAPLFCRHLSAQKTRLHTKSNGQRSFAYQSLSPCFCP